MNATMKNAPEREEIDSLLPWYAAGTLSRRDTARVEDALANDAELARARIPQPSFYLLRPDGHVGLCGGLVETDAVKEYLHGARYPR